MRRLQRLRERAGSIKVACLTGLLQNDSCLVYRRIRLQWNLPMLSCLHRIRKRNRQGNDADLRRSRLRELTGLGNALTENKLTFDRTIDSEMFHRADGGPAIRRVQRVRNSNFTNRWIKQRPQAKLSQSFLRSL